MYLDNIGKNNVLTEASLLETADSLNSAILVEVMGQLELTEYDLLTEKNIVKYDKITKFKRLEGKAAILIAKEKHDPLYEKLVKFRRMYMGIKALIRKKYASGAIARAKIAQRTGQLVDPKAKAELENKVKNGKEPKSLSKSRF